MTRECNEIQGFRYDIYFNDKDFLCINIFVHKEKQICVLDSNIYQENIRKTFKNKFALLFKYVLSNRYRFSLNNTEL